MFWYITKPVSDASQKRPLFSRGQPMFHFAVASIAMVLLVGAGAFAADKTVDDLLKETSELAQKGKLTDALASATQAVQLDAKDPRPLLARGKVQEALDNQRAAATDFTKVIELDPKNAEAYDHRGDVHFRLGKFTESVGDFDKSFELKDNPKQYWKRGISNYYAGKYEAGEKDFDAGKTIWADDVENAAWWYLCAAKLRGADKARADILKIGNDKRVPLMVVYDLYRGKAKPEDVLKAVDEGKPAKDELNSRLFYAHLYLGLWYESQGDKKKTLEHITKAAEDFDQKGYMWDVARVHRDKLRNEK